MVESSVQKLLSDRKFVDYCKQETHTILSHGYMTNQDFISILNIIMYIFRNNGYHNIQKEIFADVFEAFVIELLQKYGYNMTDDKYSKIRQVVQTYPKKNIFHK